METPSESYIGNTEDRPFEKYDREDIHLVQSFNTQQQLQSKQLTTQLSCYLILSNIFNIYIS